MPVRRSTAPFTAGLVVAALGLAVAGFGAAGRAVASEPVPAAEPPLAAPLPAPDTRIHPPRPVVRRLAGPVRICKSGLSVDVRAGETAVEDNASVLVQGAAPGFTVETWRHELPRDAAWLRPAGAVTLPDGRQAERFAFTQAEPGAPRLAYVFAGGRQSMAARWGVRSAAFDGGPGDFDLLSRVRFGEAAALACGARG